MANNKKSGGCMAGTSIGNGGVTKLSKEIGNGEDKKERRDKK